MELAAVIISVLALIIAGLSWWASKRSADAAETSAQEAAEIVQIEKARHLNENRPTFDLTGRGEMEGDLVTFTLTVTGPLPTYTVEVEAIEGSRVEALRKEAKGYASTPAITLHEMKQGVAVTFFGDSKPDSEKHQRFRLRFTDGTNGWSLYAESDIRWPPRII